MEVGKWSVKYTNRSSEFHLYPLGDIHIGVKHCSENQLVKKVKQIKDDPYAYWIGMGDMADLITPNDKRWNWGVIEEWVKPHNIGECQRKRIHEILSPIADKCLGLLEGNHEVNMKIYNHYDFMENICDSLKVPYLGFTCFVRLSFRRTKNESQQFLGAFTHGSSSATTKSGKLLALKRFIYRFNNADIHGYGHVHDIITEPSRFLDLNNADRVYDRKQAAAMTGCWLKTYEQGVPASYGELRGYDPTPIGCPVFKITPFHREISVEDK